MNPVRVTPLRPQVPPQYAGPAARAGTPPRGTRAEAVAPRLRAAAAALPPGDGLAVCCRVFLAALRPPVRGAAGDRVEVLTARLAGRLLAAIGAAAAGRPVAACWLPLVQLRHHPQVSAAQFALAGLNTHLGHDLPLTLLAAGPEGLDVLEGDLHRTVPLLDRLDEAAREHLGEGAAELNVADPVVHLAGAWSAERARQDAWTSVQILHRLRELPDLAADFTHQLDSRTALTTRLLLTPLPASGGVSAPPHPFPKPG